MTHWYEIEPADATEINLAIRLDIDAPLNEEGERCPWPWEPQQLVDVPMGQYHCGFCGAMVIAGVPHIDYADTGELEDDFPCPGCKRPQMGFVDGNHESWCPAR